MCKNKFHLTLCIMRANAGSELFLSTSIKAKCIVKCQVSLPTLLLK